MEWRKLLWDIIRIGVFLVIIFSPFTHEQKMEYMYYYVVVIIGDTIRLNRGKIFTVLAAGVNMLRKKKNGGSIEG